MSYSILLVDPVGKMLHLDRPHGLRGSTWAAGDTAARLDVTYNYADHFARVFGERGIRTIYGMTAAQSLPMLAAAINQLADDESADYWAATEGNARAALQNLVCLAARLPHGIWSGD